MRVAGAPPALVLVAGDGGVRDRADDRAEAIRADLATPEGASSLAKEVRSIVGDRLDILVANAGVSKSATIKDHTIGDFDNLFSTNVRSPFFLVQQILPVLGNGSNIVLISSLAARAVVGRPDLENSSILLYAATKGAIETLVKNWAAILGPRGIRVNAVAPGPIVTPIFGRTGLPQEAIDDFIKNVGGSVPMKRLGQSEEVAGAVAFLASSDASYITGEELHVDGGMGQI